MTAAPERKIVLPLSLALLISTAQIFYLPARADSQEFKPQSETLASMSSAVATPNIPLSKLEPKLAPEPSDTKELQPAETDKSNAKDYKVPDKEPKPDAGTPVVNPKATASPAAQSALPDASSGSSAKTTTAQPDQSKSSTTSTPASPGSSAPTSPQQAPATTKPTGIFENYPTVGKMEVITFGNAKPDERLDVRLAALEDAVFKKNFKEQSLFDRTQRLKLTILGTLDEPAMPDNLGSASMLEPGTDSVRFGDANAGQTSFLDEIAQKPENLKEVELPELRRFAVEMVNFARAQAGLEPLVEDELAAGMAREHLADLCPRNVLSHASSGGLNPDLRYTVSGGSDAITESLVSLKSDQLKTQVLSRSLVAQVLKTMMSRQDDRDSILSPDATGMGFSLAWMAANSRLIACTEISTKHGIMQPLAQPLAVGDKVEVKGLVQEPYKFERISLAWEGASTSMPAAADEAEEALPYFPPLDYVAYAGHAEHDYDTTLATLRTVGIIAAIAGGVFMPPVALAAPLIAASGGLSEPKALSDIPVHGGVKTEGLSFSGKIRFSNAGKEGIYYLTVWASTAKNGKPVPISRRAFQLTYAQDGSGDRKHKSDKHKKRKADQEEKSKQ